MNPGRQARRLRGVVALPPRPAGSLRSGHFLFLISPVRPQPAKSFLVPLPALPWHGGSILLLPGWDKSLPQVPFGHDHAKKAAASLPAAMGQCPWGRQPALGKAGDRSQPAVPKGRQVCGCACKGRCLPAQPFLLSPEPVLGLVSPFFWWMEGRKGAERGAGTVTGLYGVQV